MKDTSKSITSKSFSIRLAAVLIVLCMIVSSLITYFITSKYVEGKTKDDNYSLTATIVLEDIQKENDKLFKFIGSDHVIAENEKIKIELDNYVNQLQAAGGNNTNDNINANSNTSEIKAYLHNLPVVDQITLNDNLDYKNTINGMDKISKENVDSTILISKKTKIQDSDFDIIKKGTYSLPAYGSGSLIYPGAIIYDNDGIGNGSPAILSLDRSKDQFEIDGTVVDRKYTISVDKVSKEEIEKNLFCQLGKTSKDLNVRVCGVTSPEQVAAELGVSRNDIYDFLSDDWNGIFNGKKKVAVALLQREICQVSYNDKITDFSKLLAEGVDLETVKEAISADNPAAFVKNVHYGKAYLVSFELNTDTAFNSRAKNGFADVPELAEGVLNYFQSHGTQMTTSMKNSLSYANMHITHIGGDTDKWSEKERTNLADITARMQSDVMFDPGKDVVVPLRYEAITIGNKQTGVSIKTNADKYEICCVEGVKSGEFWCHENAKGVATQNESKLAWGIDLDKFNDNNSVVEKNYINENNNSSSRSKDIIPAYQCVFGMSVNAEALSCTCRGYNEDRFVQGGIYKGSCGGGGIRNNNVVTGPVDLSKGVYAYTKDWSRDCYCYVNGVEYGAVRGRFHNGSNVVVKRLWDEELNGNGLKKCNSLNTSIK